ncbi:MAG: signal peptidase I [Bifidobacteriaceae bacterium]|jgi:signal peptidase|nr:signal peptidase I [Bifidobacteriaceae bacterium]
MARKSGGFVGGFFRALTTVLLIGLVALAAAVAVVPAATQGKALTVLSGSMEPAFSPGDLIVVSGVDNALDLKYGDIITYLPNPNDPTLITHRIIGLGVGADGAPVFTTQGDANDVPDEPVLATQVRGKYLFHIPYLGYVSDWASRHAAWAVTGFAVILIAWGIWAFAAPRRRAKEDDGDVKTKPEPSATTNEPSAMEDAPPQPAPQPFAPSAQAASPAATQPAQSSDQTQHVARHARAQTPPQTYPTRGSVESGAGTAASYVEGTQEMAEPDPVSAWRRSIVQPAATAGVGSRSEDRP